MTTITICTTCRQPHLREDKPDPACGAVLLEQVQAAAAETDINIRGTACLMGCEHGCNIAISEHNKITYVLGRFEPGGEDAAAILDYARKYANSTSGVVPYREWPQGVKGHFIARVPPLSDDAT